MVLQGLLQGYTGVRKRLGSGFPKISVSFFAHKDLSFLGSILSSPDLDRVPENSGFRCGDP